MKNGTCPKCGSNEIMVDIKIPDRSHFKLHKPLKASVEEPEPAEKDLFWISDDASGRLGEWRCAQCGFTE